MPSNSPNPHDIRRKKDIPSKITPDDYLQKQLGSLHAMKNMEFEAELNQFRMGEPTPEAVVLPSEMDFSNLNTCYKAVQNLEKSYLKTENQDEQNHLRVVLKEIKYHAYNYMVGTAKANLEGYDFHDYEDFCEYVDSILAEFG